jgi:hypothetical protein
MSTDYSNQESATGNQHWLLVADGRAFDRLIAM